METSCGSIVRCQNDNYTKPLSKERKEAYFLTEVANQTVSLALALSYAGLKRYSQASLLAVFEERPYLMFSVAVSL